jgi:hypothetical protein
MDTKSIQPHLPTDLFRSQVLAVKMECNASTTFDHKVLDRALNRVGCDPNILVWMFLSSKNEDDFVFADELQEQVQEDGTSYSAVTIAAPVAGAGNKRKR